jgi:hypothetical protein
LYEIDSHFIFDVEHRPGRFHKVPDGLSRLPATQLNRLPPDARGRAAVPSEGENLPDKQQGEQKAKATKQHLLGATGNKGICSNQKAP